LPFILETKARLAREAVVPYLDDPNDHAKETNGRAEDFDYEDFDES